MCTNNEIKSTIDQTDNIPIWEKYVLTPEEAAAYFGYGVNKIRASLAKPRSPYVTHSGNRRLVIRPAMEKYIEEHHDLF